MKFFSRELSQALQEAGCVSESDFQWVRLSPTVIRVLCKFCTDPEYRDFGSYEIICPAFHPWDLCGGSDRARDNAKIVWHDVYNNWVIPNYDGTVHLEPFLEESTWEKKRHAIIDLPEDEQEKYVWATMKGAV